MKRSKIFLAATAGILAVTTFAFKSKCFTIRHRGYFQTNGVCKWTSAIQGYTSNSQTLLSPVLATTPGDGLNIYTVVTAQNKLGACNFTRLLYVYGEQGQ